MRDTDWLDGGRYCQKNARSASTRKEKLYLVHDRLWAQISDTKPIPCQSYIRICPAQKNSLNSISFRITGERIPVKNEAKTRLFRILTEVQAFSSLEYTVTQLKLLVPVSQTITLPARSPETACVPGKNKVFIENNSFLKSAHYPIKKYWLYTSTGENEEKPWAEVEVSCCEERSVIIVLWGVSIVFSWWNLNLSTLMIRKRPSYVPVGKQFQSKKKKEASLVRPTTRECCAPSKIVVIPEADREISVFFCSKNANFFLKMRSNRAPQLLEANKWKLLSFRRRRTPSQKEWERAALHQKPERFGTLHTQANCSRQL